MSKTKKGFTVGWIAGLSAFVISGIWMFIYVATHIGDYSCPAVVDQVTCQWDEMIFYVLQALIAFGIPGFIILTLLGLYIGWSLSKKEILRGQLIGGLGVVLLLLLTFIISKLSDKAAKYLWGEGIRGVEEVVLFLIYVVSGVLIGSVIGWIVGKFKKS